MVSGFVFPYAQVTILPGARSSTRSTNSASLTLAHMEEKIKYQSGGRRIVCTARRIKDTVAALFILQESVLLANNSTKYVGSHGNPKEHRREATETLFKTHTCVLFSIESKTNHAHKDAL